MSYRLGRLKGTPTAPAEERPRPTRFDVVSPAGKVLDTYTDFLDAQARLKQAARGGRILDEHGVVLSKRLSASQALRIADEETRPPEDADG